MGITLPAELRVRFEQRDRRALAEIVSLVENGRAPEMPAADDRSHPIVHPHIVGITGSGGAGKSTLIAALIKLLRQRQLRVAVLASDPQSPRTGGALLGDRIRMDFDPADEGVYVRSFSTRGAPGGLSLAVAPSLPWLAAFGFDVVLVETVGVGQDQVAVRDVVETLVLIVTPGGGDEVQWQKAGLLEVADIVVVNKADLPGADHVRQQLLHALSLSPITAAVPVLCITASMGEGLDPLWDTIEAARRR